MNLNQKTRFNVGYVLFAILGILLLQSFFNEFAKVRSISYSDFDQLLKDGKVEEVMVSPDEIRGRLKEKVEGKEYFVTTRVPLDVADRLEQHQVEYTGEVPSHFLATLLSWLLPVLLFVGIWVFMMRRMGTGGSQLLSIGKSKAKVYVETDTKVTFSDVAGVDEAKAELQETVEFLRNPAGAGRLGGRMPKGILLVGPPGTGKTLLARAVAGEAGVPFFSISGSEFVEMFVGVGAARVRDLFQQAALKAPCIIFIDELDALGRARAGMAGMGGHDEKEQTLNQLLVELDGFDPSTGIVILAATNRPEILDPALLRAGRFDRQVLVDRPDKLGRAAILRVHLKRIKAANDLDVEQIAALTPGFTGADLANLVNEAALAATRRNAQYVEIEDFTVAVERIVAGLEKKSRILNELERRVVAHHEMGHTIVAQALPGCDPVHKVSIIPRGIGALGYTLQRPTEDRYLMTRDEMENRMTVMLGGRAAEMIVFDHHSTGAADDLARVTDLARSMVARYAMEPSLGPIVYDVDPQPRFLGDGLGGGRGNTFSEETARALDHAVRALAERAFERALTILRRNRALLLEAAAQLQRDEVLEGPALKRILDRVTVEGSVRPGADVDETSASDPTGMTRRTSDPL